MLLLLNVWVYIVKIRSKVADRIYDVPDLLSPYFIGRENELDQITCALDRSSSRRPSRCVVYGMPGLGKTQLALKYANLVIDRRECSFVFWMSAASIDKLSSGFSKLLDLIDFPDRATLNQNAKSTAARLWLEDGESEVKRKWLLVMDNANQDTIERLREVLPRSNTNGSVLVTTRTSQVAQSIAMAFDELHTHFNLQQPTIDDAARLLLCTAEFNQTQLGPNELDNAIQFVNSIGRLPLAIDQAASFLKVSGHSLNTLLNIYQSEQVSEVCQNLICNLTDVF